MNESARELPKPSRAEAPPPRKRWLDAALLITLLPITVAAARIVLYSGGDPTLMRVLIETLDVTTLLLGTLLPMIPVVLWLAFQPIVTDLPLARQLLTRQHPYRNWWLALIIALPVLYVLLGPWPSALRIVGLMAGALMLGALTVWAIGVFRAHRSGGTWREALRVRLTVATTPLGGLGHVLIAPIVLFVVIFATPQGFWLALESITADGDQVTGYVLQTEDGWTTVMTQERAVHRYPADAVTARIICDQGQYTSLITLMVGGSPPPASTCT